MINCCTIKELKERMTFDELIDWQVYRQVRGSLNTAKRIDTAMTLNRYKTASKEDAERACWWERDIMLEEDYITVDDVVNRHVVDRFIKEQETQSRSNRLIKRIVYKQ